MSATAVDPNIGKVGQFVGGDGKTYQCLVTGADEPPWDDYSYVINYVRDGLKIEGAMIPCSSFIPDEP